MNLRPLYASLILIFSLLASCGEKSQTTSTDTAAEAPKKSKSLPPVESVPKSTAPEPQPAPNGRPGNQVQTELAWNALGAKNYAGAVSAAQKCIVDFGDRAALVEDRLTKENLPMPAGVVTPDERKQINRNGILNDVAVCYYIKGLALTALNKKTEACEAYAGAIKFPHARIWDPKRKAFWSPAEDLPAEIEKLK